MRAVLFAPPLSRSLLETALGRVDGLELVSVDSEDRLAGALPGAAILLLPQHAVTPAIGNALRDSADSLRWIQLLNAGFDRLQPGVLPAGIAVSAAGPGLAPAVSEHAVALLLSLGRGLPDAARNQGERRWDSAAKGRLSSLYGKTAAIVGFGSIGSEIARRLRGFGTRILAVSRRGLAGPLADEAFPVHRLDQALGTADAVIVALPLTAETRNLFDEGRFGQCRPGGLFVNVGRGAVVDHAALRAALASGQLAGAGLDVTDPEPLPADDPLWAMDNVIITPHCAGGGGYEALADFVADNVSRFLKGEPPLSLIAFPRGRRGPSESTPSREERL